MTVANGDGKCIGGIIGLWRRGKIEKHGDHSNHLFLLGPSVSDDGLLDLKRCVLGNTELSLSAAQQDDTSCFRDANSGSNVRVKKQFLHSHLVRLVFVDDLIHAVIDHR